MPTYLNRDNKPKRITSRQLAGFFRAQEEWFSANDAYNKERYHLDRATYLWLCEAVMSLTGGVTGQPKLKEVNEWFAEDHLIYDDDGDYLTYMNRNVRVS